MLSRFAMVAGLAVTPLVAGGAAANVTFGGTLGIPFSIGMGNTNDEFAVGVFTDDNTGNDIELGIKAKERFIGDVPRVDGTYTVENGATAVDPDLALWNIDLSIDLGGGTFADYTVVLGITDPDGDNWAQFFIGGALSPIDGDSVVQQSWNVGFDFIETGIPALGSFNGLGTFDPNQTGTYVVTLAVFEPGSGNPFALGSEIGSVAIEVVVVPTPGAAAVLGFAGLAAARRRR